MSGVPRESWGSRAGFILATAGFAVGLGNIWRFPYVVGENGGGAFLVLYLVFALLIGVPLLTMELGLGRRAQLSPIAGMVRVTGSRTSPWNAIGWLGVGTMVLIVGYYVMLVAWILAYCGLLAAGASLGGTPEQTAAGFEALKARPAALLVLAGITCLGLTLVIRRGLQKGLEGLSRVAMPVFLVMLLALAVWSVSLPGAGAGLAWLLKPDFSAVSGSVALTAMGQAFYSIGIGMGAAFALGSYLPPGTSDLPGSAAAVVALDTLVAVLAGVVIFPALFAMGQAPDSGPTLLFVTMAAMFEAMPGGQVFGFAFFALLAVAALTSVAAAFELLTSVLTDGTGLTRKGAAATVGLGSWVLSSVVILSEGPWRAFRIGERSLFSFLDTLSGTYMLTTGAFLISLYVAVAWGWHGFRDEANRGAGRVRVGPAWGLLVRWVIPLAVGVLLLLGLGVL